MVTLFHIQIISILEMGPDYFDMAEAYIDEHRSILDALLVKDEEQAERRTRNHIRDGKELVLKSLKKGG